MAAPARIAIVTAVDVELAAIAKRLKLKRSEDNNDMFEGTFKEGLITATTVGIGKDATQRFVSFVRGKKFDLFINAGFAGGLIDDLSVGDIVQPRQLLLTFGQPISMDGPTPQVVRERMRGDAERLLRDTLLTVDQIVETPDAKHRLGLQHRAGSTDMEAYHLAVLAAQHSLPMIIIKAISDIATQTMPAWTEKLVSPEGKVDTKAATILSLTMPWRLPALKRMKQGADTAGRALAHAVDRTISRWLAERSRAIAPPDTAIDDDLPAA